MTSLRSGVKLGLMKKLILSLFVFLLSCMVVQAKPMWQISDKWTCKVTLHTKITVDGKVIGVNDELSRTFLHYYDFKKSIATSAWGDSVGKITNKSYIKNQSYNQNIIIVDWSGWGEIVSVIHEQRGEFWDTSSSGFNNPKKTVWTSHSKCWFD